MHTSSRYCRSLLVLLLYIPLLLVANENQIQQTSLENSERPFIPGDGILLTTFPDTSSFLHNKIFPIDKKGFVDFPIVGMVNVSQMSESELIEYIKINFRQYVLSPNVSIRPMMRVTVIGGVANPGLFYFDYNSSLWSVIQRAGGPLSEDGLKKMKWQRKHDEVRDDLIPFIKDGTSLKDMGFQSGDEICTPIPIPPARFTYLPLVTFASSIIFFYLTYQMQLYIYSVLNRR